MNPLINDSNFETNSIQPILASWSQAVKNKNETGVRKAIHSLKENLIHQDEKAKVAQEIFTNLKSQRMSEKSFGLEFINDSDKRLVMKDLKKILNVVFSSYSENSDFRGSEIDDLYYLLQSYETKRLASPENTKKCLKLIKSMPNVIYRNRLFKIFIEESIKSNNIQLLDDLISNNLVDLTKQKIDLNFLSKSPEKMDLVFNLVRRGLPISANHDSIVNMETKTFFFKTLIKEGLLNPNEPFDKSGISFNFWALERGYHELIPVLIEHQGENVFLEKHNDQLWIDKVVKKQALMQNLSTDSPICSFMRSSDLGYQKFAITNQERLDTAVANFWPLHLILNLLPKENTSSLQEISLHKLFNFHSHKKEIGEIKLLMEIIKNLVRGGANINAVNDKGKTLLDTQIGDYGFDLAIVRELLKMGAKTALNPALFSLWKLNQRDCLKLIRDGVLDPNIIDADGNTLLHKITQEGNLTDSKDPSLTGQILVNNDILALLELGANPHQPNQNGITPFFQAITGKTVSITPAVHMISTFKKLYFKFLPEAITPPFHLAMITGDIEKAKSLLNVEDFDVNKADENKITRLHLAVDADNMELIEILIKKGAMINSQDANGISPLHLAAFHQNVEIVDLLLKNIEHSSNKKEFVNTTIVNSKITPLGIALLCKNIELVEKFTENIDITDFSDGIIGHLITTCVPNEKDKQILQLVIERGLIPKKPVSLSDLKEQPYGFAVIKQLNQKHPNLSTSDLYDRVKSLGHALALKGDVTHMVGSSTNISDSIRLEGHSAQLNMSRMSIATALFFKEYPEIAFSSAGANIKHMLNYSAQIGSHSSEQILKRIEKRVPVLLPVGFLGHSLQVLFTQDEEDKPVFALCNTGGENRFQVVELHHYDQSKLTSEIITKILKSKDSSSTAFRNLFYDELPASLSFTPSERLNELLSDSPVRFQTVGNCTWTSIEAAMWMQFQFEALKIGTDRTLMREYGNLIYTHWRLFTSAIQMENYLKHLEDEHLSPNQDDFLKSFQNFWRNENNSQIDHKLRQRILDLHKRCFALFPTRVEDPVPSGWIKAQKTFWNQWENLKNLATWPF